MLTLPAVQHIAIRVLLMAPSGDHGAMKRLTYLSDGPPLTEDEVQAQDGEHE